ncbi:MAG: hypothetical protein LBU15_01450, partial [Rickettsiales bacterium]|nr:hypothetical protein [Rickettsiales bacterium]
MLADYRAKLEKFLSEELAENNLFPDLFGPGACDRKIKLINSRGCSAICRVYSEKLGKPVILEILEENERKPIDTGTLPLVRGSLALVECYGLEKRRIADRESNIVAMEYCEGGKLKNMPIGARRNSIEKSFSHLLLGL